VEIENFKCSHGNGIGQKSITTLGVGQVNAALTRRGEYEIDRAVVVEIFGQELCFARREVDLFRAGVQLRGLPGGSFVAVRKSNQLAGVLHADQVKYAVVVHVGRGDRDDVLGGGRGWPRLELARALVGERVQVARGIEKNGIGGAVVVEI